MTNASEVLTRELEALPVSEQATFLRDVLHSAAAVLVFVGGVEAASEEIYKLADRVAVLKP